MTAINGPVGRALWQRADRVLPGGGIYLTRSARFAGHDVQPGFVVEAEGCRVTDADGRRYLDFLCANGPVLLGYRHPEVEDAARAQALRADSASYFPPALVELAEQLVARTPGTGWAVPVKNGSDAVTLALRVARAATGRSAVLAFEHAYHGFDPELAPGARPSATLVRVPWNDPERLLDAARARRNDVAALLLNPLDQSPGCETRWPEAELLRAVEEVRERTGALLVLDDVRHGFRLGPKGSHAVLGLAPDLLCLGKALGNGHPVSALLGSESLRGAARGLLFTASYAFGAVALRAAQRTVEIFDRDDVHASLERAGLRLRDGLQEAAARAGQRLRWSGPPSMPTLLFDDDPGLARGRRFAREAALRGALFHPALNGFLCAAHDDAAIDEAVAIASQALATLPAPDAPGDA